MVAGHRRWWIALVVAGAVALIASGVTVAYLKRIAPPYPLVEGTPSPIELAPGGCPIIPDRWEFVDAPGELVPPNPYEVLLCTTSAYRDEPIPPDGPPLQRILRTGAPEFAAFLKRLPDRNQDFRAWQREHSGWWPDPLPFYVCPNIGLPYNFSFVLRYADRPTVAVLTGCMLGGVTTGVRTRIDNTKPHVVDEFVRLFDAQR